MKTTQYLCILLLLVGLGLEGCTKEKSQKVQKAAEPEVAFGYPYQEPGKKLPSQIVLVYLDGTMIECDGKVLQMEEIEGYVTGLIVQKKSDMIFVYSTSDVLFGRVVQVLEHLKKTPVHWIRVDDRNIPAGYRFPQ